MGCHRIVDSVSERLRRVHRALSQWKKKNNTNSLDIRSRGFFRQTLFHWNGISLKCLIPKKVNSPLMADYRPISLCSVLYKVVSKICGNASTPYASDSFTKPVHFCPGKTYYIIFWLLMNWCMDSEPTLGSLRSVWL